MTGLSLVAQAPAELLRTPDLSPVQSLVDFLTEGSSLAPRLREAEAIVFVGELSHAAADLSSAQRARAVVRLCAEPDPWELGLERSGSEVLLSLFQGGGVPDVAVFERRIPFDLFASQIRRAVRALSGSPSRRCPANNDTEEPPCSAAGDFSPNSAAAEPFAAISTRLEAALPASVAPPSEPETVSVEPTGEVSIVIAAEIILRSPPGPCPPAPSGPPPSVLRADLFSLLFRGRMKVAVGDHTRELPRTCSSSSSPSRWRR